MATVIVAPEGPYSPIAGPDSLTFCGGLLALSKRHGIDTANMADDQIGRIYETKDPNGHTWFVRFLGDPFWFAFRDRTPEEIDALEEEYADRCFSSWFSSERLRYCLEIGARVQQLLERFSPDRVQSRAARRNFKQQLSVLLDVQTRLMYDHTIKLAEVRERLSPFGLPYKRRAR